MKILENLSRSRGIATGQATEVHQSIAHSRMVMSISSVSLVPSLPNKVGESDHGNAE